MRHGDDDDKKPATQKADPDPGAIEMPDRGTRSIIGHEDANHPDAQPI